MSRRFTAYASLVWVALAGPVAAQEPSYLQPIPLEPQPPEAAAPAPQPQPPPPEPAPPGMAQGRDQMLRDRRFAPRDAQAEAEYVRRTEELRLRREAILKAEQEREQRAIAERRAAPGYGIARVSIAASVDSSFYDDAGYDLFDDNDVSPRLGLWVGYDVAQLSDRLTLAIDAGVGGEMQEQVIWDGDIETELDATTISGGLSLRYAALSWLDPQVRASAGISLFTFELDVAGQSFEDNLTSGFGTIGAGLLFHTPALTFENSRGRFASFGIGLLVEGGYALRGPIEPSLEAGVPPHAIARTRASLGELALSGPYVRTSLVTRF